MVSERESRSEEGSKSKEELRQLLQERRRLKFVLRVFAWLFGAMVAFVMLVESIVSIIHDMGGFKP